MSIESGKSVLEEDFTGSRSSVSIVLMALLIFVTGALLAFMNVSSFRETFNSTTINIIITVGLFGVIGLFILYIMNRDRMHRRNLEELVDRLKKSNALLNSLYRIESMANSGSNLRDFLNGALRVASDSMDSSGGAVFLMDEKSGMLKVEAAIGRGFTESERETASGQGMIGKAFSAAMPITQSDFLNEETQAANHAEKVSRIAVPLIAKEKAVGVIVLADKHNRGLGDEGITLLKTIAEVIGGAVTDVMLYDITRRAVESLRKNQTFMDNMMNAFPFGIITIDRAGKIVRINKEAESLLGLNRGNLPSGVEELSRRGDWIADLCERAMAAIKTAPKEFWGISRKASISSGVFPVLDDGVVKGATIVFISHKRMGVET